MSFSLSFATVGFFTTVCQWQINLYNIPATIYYPVYQFNFIFFRKYSTDLHCEGCPGSYINFTSHKFTILPHPNTQDGNRCCTSHFRGYLDEAVVRKQVGYELMTRGKRSMLIIQYFKYFQCWLNHHKNMLSARLTRVGPLLTRLVYIHVVLTLQPYSHEVKTMPMG